MVYSVKDALRNEGRSYEICEEIAMEPLEYIGTINFVTPVQVKGTYSCIGEGIEAAGTITALLGMECDLCAQSFQMPMQLDFSEQFLLNGTDDQDYYPISDDQTIDILPLVQDNIISNIPLERLCKEDCKGICPYCGVNKNFSTCLCTPPEKGNPFSVLRKLVD